MIENQIEIYTSPDGSTQVEVQFEGDTIWLNLNQMSSLFEKDKSVISRHLKNVFTSGELIRDSVVAKNATTAQDGKTYTVEYYNLDAILSVGYRVNSKRGTQFRQWATKRLKDYLIEGVAINEKRLAQKNKEIQVLHDGIRILSRTIEDQATNNENYAFLHQFSVGLKLLDDYDHESLDENGKHTKKAEYPSMAEYMEIVEKDGGFDSAVNQIRQGFGEQDAYPSIEEKAAMLLYLVVKNSHYQQRSSCQSNLICGSISELYA